MQRRQLLAALAAATLAPTLARAGVTRVPLSNAFLLLTDYLKLPANKRDLFHFAYLARHKDKPATDAKATYVLADGTRTPVVFSANGEVTNLPTLAQLKSKAKFENDGAPLQFGLELRATVQPASRLDVPSLQRALAQANEAVAIFTDGQAGRLTDAYFPDAGGGQVLLSGGSATPLATFDFPALGHVPYIDLSRAHSALAVQLDHAPSRIMFAGPPHKS